MKDMQNKQVEYIDKKQPVRTIKRNFKKAWNTLTARIRKIIPKFYNTPVSPRTYKGGRKWQFRTLHSADSVAIQNECKKYATTKGLNSRKRLNGNLI